MEVMQLLDRPASQRFYAVAGRLLFIENIDPRLSALIDRLFAGWQLTPLSFSDRSADIRIEFFCCDSKPHIPINLQQFEIADGGRCHSYQDGFYLETGDSLMHLENGAPVSVRVWFEKLPVLGDPVAGRVSSFAVCAALRRFGLFELHSAGMVHPDSEKGVLIVGPSGRGKSTLALQLAMSGWSYLSDDEVLLSLVDGVVKVSGFRGYFAVNGADALAAGIGLPGGMNNLYKTCFEPEAVFSARRRKNATPAVLFFTSVTGKPETRLDRLTPAESMTRLIRACPWASYDRSIAGANLKVLSKLARQTSAFDLHAGRDLLEPGYASHLLSQYAGT